MGSGASTAATTKFEEFRAHLNPNDEERIASEYRQCMNDQSLSEVEAINYLVKKYGTLTSDDKGSHKILVAEEEKQGKSNNEISLTAGLGSISQVEVLIKETSSTMVIKAPQKRKSVTIDEGSVSVSASPRRNSLTDIQPVRRNSGRMITDKELSMSKTAVIEAVEGRRSSDMTKQKSQLKNGTSTRDVRKREGSFSNKPAPAVRRTASTGTVDSLTQQPRKQSIDGDKNASKLHHEKSQNHGSIKGAANANSSRQLLASSAGKSDKSSKSASPTKENTTANEDSSEEEKVYDEIMTGEKVQYVCRICNGTFESLPVLERHIKYSYIHAKNLREQLKNVERGKLVAFCADCLQKRHREIMEKEEKYSRPRKRWCQAIRRVLYQIAVGKTTTMLDNLYHHQNLRKIASIDGAFPPPVLIYQASKLFWRSHESVEFSFFLHTKVGDLMGDTEPAARVGGVGSYRQIIEVVSRYLDASNTEHEFNRLYLDYEKLKEHLKPEIDEAVAKDQSTRLRRRYSVSQSTHNDGFVQTARKIVSDWLLAKLDVSVDDEAKTKTVYMVPPTKTVIRSSPSSNDADTGTPTTVIATEGGLPSSQPISTSSSSAIRRVRSSVCTDFFVPADALEKLRPAEVKLRRRASLADLTNMHANFLEDRGAIKEEVKNAEEIAKTAQESVDALRIRDRIS